MKGPVRLTSILYPCTAMLTVEYRVIFNYVNIINRCKLITIVRNFGLFKIFNLRIKLYVQKIMFLFYMNINFCDFFRDFFCHLTFRTGLYIVLTFVVYTFLLYASSFIKITCSKNELFIFHFIKLNTILNCQ